MGKRTILLSMAAGLVLATASALPAGAQDYGYSEEPRTLTFYVDLGYVNLADYPKWVAVGPELEVRLGRLFTLNPEVGLWLRSTYGDTAKIVPGATLNLRLRRFFVGAGAVRRVFDWSEDASGWLLPKFQAGFFTGPAKVALVLFYLNQTDTVVLSLNLGVGFGRR